MLNSQKDLFELPEAVTAELYTMFFLALGRGRPPRTIGSFGTIAVGSAIGDSPELLECSGDEVLAMIVAAFPSIVKSHLEGILIGPGWDSLAKADCVSDERSHS